MEHRLTPLPIRLAAESAAKMFPCLLSLLDCCLLAHPEDQLTKVNFTALSSLALGLAFAECDKNLITLYVC